MQPQNALHILCARAEASVSAHVCAAADVLIALTKAAARVKTAAAALQRTHGKRLDDVFEELDANANVLRAWHQNAHRVSLESLLGVPVVTAADACAAFGAPCIQLRTPPKYAFGEVRAYSISPPHCIISDLETWMTHAPSLVEARIVQLPAADSAYCEPADGITRQDMELRFACASTGVPIEVAIDVHGKLGKFRIRFKIPDAHTSVRATLLVAGSELRQWTVRRIGALGVFQHAVQEVPFPVSKISLGYVEQFCASCRVEFKDDGIKLSALDYTPRVFVAAPHFPHFTHKVVEPWDEETLLENAKHKLETLHPHYVRDLYDLICLPAGGICALRLFQLDPCLYSMDFYVPSNGTYQWQRRIVISAIGIYPAKLVLIDDEQIGVAERVGRVRLYDLRSLTLLHTFDLPERAHSIAWRQQRLLIFTDQLNLLVYA